MKRTRYTVTEYPGRLLSFSRSVPGLLEWAFSEEFQLSSNACELVLAVPLVDAKMDSDPNSAAAWSTKRIKPWSQSLFVSDSKSEYLPYDDNLCCSKISIKEN